jgi:hypothetical protein
MSYLSDYLRNLRRERAMGVSELASTIGYANLTKGVNRIRRFEETGEIDFRLLKKLVEVFQIDPEKIEELIEQDRREFFEKWSQWASEAIKPYLVARLVPGVYNHIDLPDDVAANPSLAEVYAAAIARKSSRKICLVLSRRISVWLDEKGEVCSRSEAAPGEGNEPYMQIGAKKRMFTWDLSFKSSFRSVGWPKKPGVVGPGSNP